MVDLIWRLPLSFLEQGVFQNVIAALRLGNAIEKMESIFLGRHETIGILPSLVTCLPQRAWFPLHQVRGGRQYEPSVGGGIEQVCIRFILAKGKGRNAFCDTKGGVSAIGSLSAAPQTVMLQGKNSNVPLWGF